jgi:hypothetical protein
MPRTSQIIALTAVVMMAIYTLTPLIGIAQLEKCNPVGVKPNFM